MARLSGYQGASLRGMGTSEEMRAVVERGTVSERTRRFEKEGPRVFYRAKREDFLVQRISYPSSVKDLLGRLQRECLLATLSNHARLETLVFCFDLVY
jgi:hypothetical protein